MTQCLHASLPVVSSVVGEMLRGVLPLLHQAQRAGTQLQSAEQQQKGRVCTGRHVDGVSVSAARRWALSQRNLRGDQDVQPTQAIVS